MTASLVFLKSHAIVRSSRPADESRALVQSTRKQITVTHEGRSGCSAAYETRDSGRRRNPRDIVPRGGADCISILTAWSSRRRCVRPSVITVPWTIEAKGGGRNDRQARAVVCCGRTYTRARRCSVIVSLKNYRNRYDLLGGNSSSTADAGRLVQRFPNFLRYDPF